MSAHAVEAVRHPTAPGFALVPWANQGRRSPVRDAAAPLLTAALRRLALVPGAYRADAVALDRLRATRQRLASALIWARAHAPAGAPPVPPVVRYLPHVGYILNGVGLTPTRVFDTFHATGITAKAEDDALIRAGHLSALEVLTIEELTRLH